MDFTKKRKVEENGTVAATTVAAVTLTAEDARKLLQPLTQDQLLDVLQNAVVRHPDVLDAVRLLANRDTAHRKLFVRGLGADTTSESLRGVFAAFGELDEAIVIFDKATGKSKGYGFVTFKNADSALIALRQPSKKIDGRITVTQFAAAGTNNNSNSSTSAAINSASSDVAARKIYVGNVPFDISAERLLSHFMMYGEIEEGPLGFDRNTGKSRGFAFFVYKTEEGARAALVDPMKSIDGHQVACKLAVDNKKPKLQPDTAAAAASAPPPFQGSQYGPGPPQGLYYPAQGQAAAVVPGGNFGLNSSIQVPGNGGGFGPSFAGYGQVPPAGDFSGRLQQPSAGAYAEASRYNLGSSGQHGQQAPVPRIPPGGMYHHYY